ncbi:MAG: hypothetical protein LBE70_03295 [Nitrososphaerota archaeon]|jgi:uncharacterized protein YqhQ|nr:hypothetical protein [Nitrososphaerota archaeon]
MPKTAHTPEKVQKQKKTIGAIAIILLVIIMIISIMFRIRIIIWIPIELIVFGAARIIMKKIEKSQHNK